MCRPTSLAPDAAARPADEGKTRFQVVSWRRCFPRSRAAGEANRSAARHAPLNGAAKSLMKGNVMIAFPAIWWLFSVISLGLILFSLYLTKSDRLESKRLRYCLVASGAFFGLLAFVLPFFQQPHFQNPILNYAVGLPLTVVGLIGRVYPMIYLRQQGTTTAMEEVGKLVDTGPYRWVRHPQYTFGFILLCGWFLVWGAVYSLCLMPLIGVIIYSQALIEERYVLEKKFGREYAEYKKRVGMLIPRIVKEQPKQPRAGQSDRL